MPELRIPPQYRPALQKLVELESEVEQQLFDILKAERPALGYGNLASHVASKFAGGQSGDIKDIVETILALYSVRTYLESSIHDFARDISESADLKIPEEKREHFRDCLTKLLGFESLSVTSKAINVVADNEHTLYDARILTDVRPVFKDNPEEPPVAVTIVHMLKISYRHGTDFRDFFVALDSDDIEILSKLLDRAKAKENTLKTILSGAGLSYLGGETS